MNQSTLRHLRPLVCILSLALIDGGAEAAMECYAREVKGDAWEALGGKVAYIVSDPSKCWVEDINRAFEGKMQVCATKSRYKKIVHNPNLNGYSNQKADCQTTATNINNDPCYTGPNIGCIDVPIGWDAWSLVWNTRAKCDAGIKALQAAMAQPVAEKCTTTTISTTTITQTTTTTTVSTTTTTISLTTTTETTTTTTVSTTTTTETTTTTTQTTSTSTTTPTSTTTSTTARVCTTGERHDPSRNQCRPCPQGTFNDRQEHSIEVCQAWRACGADQFVSTPPSATADRVCGTLGECDSETQYESKAPSGETNRECTSLRDCGAGEYVEIPQTKTANRRCGKCYPSDGGWQDAAEGANQPACKKFKSCKTNERVAQFGSRTTDIVCEACPDGFEQLRQNHRKDRCDRTATTTTATVTSTTTSNTGTAKPLSHLHLPATALPIEDALQSSSVGNPTNQTDVIVAACGGERTGSSFQAFFGVALTLTTIVLVAALAVRAGYAAIGGAGGDRTSTEGYQADRTAAAAASVPIMLLWLWLWHFMSNWALYALACFEFGGVLDTGLRAGVCFFCVVLTLCLPLTLWWFYERFRCVQNKELPPSRPDVVTLIPAVLIAFPQMVLAILYLSCVKKEGPRQNMRWEQAVAVISLLTSLASIVISAALAWRPSWFFDTNPALPRMSRSWFERGLSPCFCGNTDAEDAPLAPPQKAAKVNPLFDSSAADTDNADPVPYLTSELPAVDAVYEEPQAYLGNHGGAPASVSDGYLTVGDQPEYAEADGDGLYAAEGALSGMAGGGGPPSAMTKTTTTLEKKEKKKKSGAKEKAGAKKTNNNSKMGSKKTKKKMTENVAESSPHDLAGAGSATTTTTTTTEKKEQKKKSGAKEKAGAKKTNNNSKMGSKKTKKKMTENVAESSPHDLAGAGGVADAAPMHDMAVTEAPPYEVTAAHAVANNEKLYDADDSDESASGFGDTPGEEDAADNAAAVAAAAARAEKAMVAKAAAAAKLALKKKEEEEAAARAARLALENAFKRGKAGNVADEESIYFTLETPLRKVEDTTFDRGT